jgi:hypothetical protein
MGTLNRSASVKSGHFSRALLVPVVGLGVFLSASAMAGQIDSSAYFHLRRGMSESEILVRAGPPDLVTSPGQEVVQVRHGVVDRGDDGDVSFDSFQRTRIPAISSWHYVPDPDETDPFITIVTFRAGEVWELQRRKVFSRYKPNSSATAPDRESVTDTDIQRERADNTLKAAEAYAATRAKLKEQGGDAGANAPAQASTTIYKGVQPDGSTYFGDSPPGETPKTIPVN